MTETSDRSAHQVDQNPEAIVDMRPPVVLLPGSLCDERLFTHQVLALRGAGHEVLVAELRPHVSIASMADHVTSLVDGPFIAIGLSLGGIVAAEIAARHPDRLAGVAVLDTNLRAPSADQVATRRAWEADVRSGKLWQLVTQHLIQRQTSFPSRNGQLIFAMAQSASSAGFLSDNAALLDRHDRRANLAPIAAAGIPVLIACGDEDLVCPPSVHADLAARTKGAVHVVLPRAGHLATIDQPHAVSELLIGWVDDISTEIHTQEGNHAHQHA